MYKQGITVFIALLSMLALCPAAFGQSDSVLRWTDIESAIDRHPAMKLAEDQAAAAEAEIGVSRQYPNPEVGTSIGQGRAIDGSEEALIWGIELQIPIDAPGAYLNETEAARAGHQAAKFEAAARKLEVVRKLKGLFHRIAIGQERLRIQRENVSQLERLVEVAHARVKSGQARPMEAARLEIVLEAQQADLNAFEKTLESLRKNLNVWLGGKLPSDYVVSFEWRALPRIPENDELMQLMLSNHPTMRAAAQRILASEATVRAERHRLFPTMSLGGFYDRELDSHNYGGMLSIELPLWNWNQGGIAKAKAMESAARHQRDLTERELQVAFTETQAVARQAIDRARRYADVIIPKTRETAKALEAMYRMGEADIMDLLDARRTLTETETRTLAAFESAWLSYLDLITLTGGEYE